MTYEPYPKWLYHADGRVMLVRSASEHDAYRREWAETPARPLPQGTVEEDVRRPKKDAT